MNAKSRLLSARKLFINYTDEMHYISMGEIKQFFKNIGYTVDRKTVLSDIEALVTDGMDIEYVHNKGYHLKSHPFSLSILKILADAVASFRFLTVEDSEKLLKLLESLCSIYEAPLLRRGIILANRVKSDNEQIFDNIAVINFAFRNNCQISFDYYDYDINNHLVLRGKIRRVCSPLNLIINNEHYYVVSYYKKYDNTYTNFRLDRMKNIKIIDSTRNFPDEPLDLGQYIKSSFCMFSGKSEYVTLRFPLENKYCNIVTDKFGKSVLMLKDKESSNHFIIHVPIKSEFPQTFFAWLFAFNGNVTIIKPEKLRELYSKVLFDNCKRMYV